MHYARQGVAHCAVDPVHCSLREREINERNETREKDRERLKRRDSDQREKEGKGRGARKETLLFVHLEFLDEKEGEEPRDVSYTSRRRCNDPVAPSREKFT